MSGMGIRETRPGETGLVASFYTRVFMEQFDFLPSTERYFMHAAGELLDDPEGSRMWVCEDGGRIVGSVAIVRKGEGEAQLRLFGVDAGTQGRGIGGALLERAMAFCRERNYTYVWLWTIDICKSAVRMYERLGFHVTEEKPNNEWAAYPMTELKMELHLERPHDTLAEKDELRHVDTPTDMERFVGLVSEYTSWVASHGSRAQEVLDGQHLADELADMGSKYGRAGNAMYLYLVGGEPAGCAAILGGSDGTCEIKRLYVREGFRGRGISWRLAGQAIADARKLGYEAMRLDTFSWMTSAISLYKSLGFRRIGRYNDNEAPDAVFMELSLS